eukprot:2263181-Pleurochrysis_carterae.AAC.1
MAHASCVATRRAALCALDGAWRLLELDEAVHGALLDTLFAERSMDFLDVVPGRAHSTHAVASGATGVETQETVIPSVRQLSAPIATPARVLIATSARRNALKRSRHLQNGQGSVGFVVDSGCTWRIHPHISDLVNVRDCDDL